MHYQKLVENVSTMFKQKMDNIETEYNFDLGLELEVAFCEALRMFLPSKFGVCRGFIVNAEDQTAGDDIIIYDKSIYAPLRGLAEADSTRKQKYPLKQYMAT